MGPHFQHSSELDPRRTLSVDPALETPSIYDVRSIATDRTIACSQLRMRPFGLSERSTPPRAVMPAFIAIRDSREREHHDASDPVGAIARSGGAHAP